jgi:virulence-associated protein VagC
MPAMRARIVAVTLFLTGIAGCAGPDTPDLGYLPPSGQPAADRNAFVRQQAWLVRGNIVDYLRQRAVAFDEAAGKLVVVYRGDPEPYVDCGWIVTHDDDEFNRFPAARSDARLLRRRDGEAVTLERDLRLDARMDVHVVPSGEDAIVRPESTYVLTKTIESADAEQPLHNETITFHTGQSGTFSSGTTCQPNGELERLVLEVLPTVSLVSD